MAQIPTGIMSLPLANLQTLVASSAAFQAWVGAVDANAAKSHIHLVNLPTTSLVRPFCLIGFADKWKSQKTAEFFHFKRGELFLLFEADVALLDQPSEADAVFAFMNQVGDVMAEVLAVAGTDAFLNVVELEMTSEPTRITSDDAQIGEDYYTVEFNVVWEG